MKYTYKILDQVYNWMITKQKNIEIRPFNEKADIIKIGDYITFYNKDNETEFVKTKVIDKKIYNSIEEILNEYDINSIMPNHTIEDIKETLIKIYGENIDIKKYVVFTFDIE